MDLAVIFVIGFVASFFGSFTSSGASLLSFAFLGMYGLSPFAILGIFKVGAVGFQLGGLYNYAKADKIVWRYVLPLTLIGVAGSYVGANIVLSLNEIVLSKIIGIAMFLCVPFSLLKPTLGIQNVQVSNIKERVGYVMSFVTSIWGSSLVVGAGLLNMYSQMYFFGMTILEVRGTTKIPGLIKSVVVLWLFIKADIINWHLALIFLCGTFLGSLVGTHYSVKIGDTWLRYILLVSVLIVSVKLIFGL